MNQVIETIISRRSCRKYKAEPLPRETVEAIIEAGRYAPSGHNSQTTRLIVFSSHDKTAALNEVCVSALAAMDITDDMYASLANYVRRAKAGGLDVTFGAPVLIITANKRGYGNAMADSACAIENMFIAATSLGVGCCWVNQPHWLDNEPKLREHLAQFGLEDDETVTGGLVLGVPQAAPAAPLPRKGNPVNWV